MHIFHKMQQTLHSFFRVWTNNATCRKLFRKFSKIFLRKLRKIIIFTYFSKKFANPAFKFCAFGRKMTLYAGNFWENFWKFWKDFSWKLLKLYYFSLFSKNLTNDAFLFSAFGRKRRIIGNFEKIFENFEKFL